MDSCLISARTSVKPTTWRRNNQQPRPISTTIWSAFAPRRALGHNSQRVKPEIKNRLSKISLCQGWTNPEHFSNISHVFGLISWWPEQINPVASINIHHQKSMTSPVTRRQFLALTSPIAAVALLPGLPVSAAAFRGRIRKAKIVGEVTEAVLKPLKDAGFDGVETTLIGSEEEGLKGRATAEKLGLRVHSVLRGWMEFNSEDPQKVEGSLEQTRKALRAAKGYGA